MSVALVVNLYQNALTNFFSKWIRSSRRKSGYRARTITATFCVIIIIIIIIIIMFI